MLCCVRNDMCHVVTDLQMVNISLRVLSRPDARMLPTMYRQLGVDYDERVLPSICNEVSCAAFTYYITLVYVYL